MYSSVASISITGGDGRQAGGRGLAVIGGAEDRPTQAAPGSRPEDCTGGTDGRSLGGNPQTQRETAPARHPCVPAEAAAGASAGAVWEKGELFMPQTAHLQGGPQGQVSAELSASHMKWVYGLKAFTVGNLGNRLIFGRLDVGCRRTGLGCFFTEAARVGFMGYAYAGTGLPSGNCRFSAQADRCAYDATVRLVNL